MNNLQHLFYRFIAGILLVLASPLFLLFYILVKATSKGPFIFRQERLGKDRKPFIMYKIRTMLEDAENLKSKLTYLNEADGPVFKIKNDPRYTKIGKLISHTGLDELPQLINVIKGEMSFVGPRPLPKSEADRVPKQYEKRYSVLPGITSPWVVMGSHRLSFKEWMESDLEYVKKRSLYNDGKIFVLTTFLIIKIIVSKYFMKKLLIFIIILSAIGFFYYKEAQTSKNNNLKLYWFIPDGVRAEPELFNIYKWAKEGKLPNIKKLMEMGSYGYSRPTFPSHTPVNFATLLTGSLPEVHGIDDGPMHAVGMPLDKVAVPGFRSTARKVPAIWKTLEGADMKVTVLSVPGSTPPEINKGVVLRGRWGGWGADFFALNFETKGDLSQRVKQGLASRLFYFGPQLTQYVDPAPTTDWGNGPKSYSDPLEIILKGYGTPVYGYIYDSSNDNSINYDRIAFSLDKKDIFADLKPGDWSDWKAITLKWTVENKGVDVASDVKVTVIKLNDDGFYRVRLFYNNLNKYIAFPPETADMVKSEAGPMVDFVDNFPFQLGFYPEDRKTFLQEADMSFDWHNKAVKTLINQFNPNVVIHDIYTPNQMLTAPWWMPYVDPKSDHYQQATKEEISRANEEVMDMYVKLDKIIGEILKVAGKNTYVVFSSDHGNIPLNKYVNLNNLFAKNGWLTFRVDSKTGEPIVDWQNSKVIYLKMAHVYINPNGLAGKYQRASGPEYEKLRNEVQDALTNLTDEDGAKPVTAITKWEDVKNFLQMDPDRAGDLIIANAPGYGWSEDMSEDLNIFVAAKEGGYKQAVDPDLPGMWTPFMISGPGIKANNFLGDKPIGHIDQYPTLMKALKVKVPDFVQGKALSIFK